MMYRQAPNSPKHDVTGRAFLGPEPLGRLRHHPIGDAVEDRTRSSGMSRRSSPSIEIDPSEDATYTPGSERPVFNTGPLTFGVAICHEGWRYPETVRFAARRGAQVVFHPHFHPPEPGSYRPTTFGDPANTFHEKAILCRAAENTCYVASVNYAIAGSGTTSAIARPDGTLVCYQPYGEEGLLIADLDLSEATGLLARRLRTIA